MVGGAGHRAAAVWELDRHEELHADLRDHGVVPARRDLAVHCAQQAVGEREQATVE